MTSLAAIRKNPRVEIVDDERSCGNGIIVTLKQGWTFDEMQDNRVAGEETVAEAAKLVRSAKRFAGPYVQ
jgi:hypothetical protein